MPTITEIRAPQEPNAGATFDSLRRVADQHAARVVAYGTGYAHGHAELVALLTGVVERARAAIAALEHAPAPSTPTGAETRARELAAQHDIERAYGELILAQSSACGDICNPV